MAVSGVRNSHSIALLRFSHDIHTIELLQVAQYGSGREEQCLGE